jgi:hypothetical protein
MTALISPISRARTPRRCLRALAGLIAVVLGSFIGRAGASTIYSDLGTGDSFDTSHGLVIGKQPFNLSQAAEFVNGAGGDVSLGQVDLGLSYISGGNAAIVSLWSAAQDAPGSELAQWSITVPADPVTSSLMSITDINAISLRAGAAYFLQVEPVAADSILTWNLNDVGATTRLFSVTAGGSAQSDILNAPAFRLSGTVVPTPLPASVWLILAGLLPLAWVGRKKSLHPFKS